MPSDKRQRQKERERAAREAQAAADRRSQQRRNFIRIGGLIVAVVAAAALYSFLAGGDDDDETATDTTVETTETTEAADPLDCPAEDGSSEQTLDFPAPPPDCLVEGATYEAVFDTTAGEVRVALDTEATPATVNNFVYLARYGYYDGTDMFRTNTGIDIIQGGSPHTNDNSDPGPGYTIEDEGADWTYEPGDLVMARTPAPNSASAQYFFAAGPNVSGLDFGGGSSGAGTYVKFGRVTEGLDVLEAILASHVDGDEPGEGAPDPIPVVNSVTIVQTGP